MQFTTSLLTFTSLATLAFTAPNLAPRQSSVIYPCTASKFPADDPCPFGEPIGTGYCAALSVEPGNCYNWASFPAEQVAPLIGNLTFVQIPNQSGAVNGCKVYMTDDCTGDSTTLSVGENDFSCGSFGDVTFNDKVASFECYVH